MALVNRSCYPETTSGVITPIRLRPTAKDVAMQNVCVCVFPPFVNLDAGHQQNKPG